MESSFSLFDNFGNFLFFHQLLKEPLLMLSDFDLDVVLGSVGLDNYDRS